MNDIENLLKNLNSLEGQERIKKYTSQYFQKINEKNKKVQEILSNTDYIKWLDNFTKKYSSFSDNDWLYFPDKLTNTDLNGVNDLHLIYLGIENYASENYIYPTKCDFGAFYKINFENTGFEIGILVGQGTIFFCNRVLIEDKKEFIDFNDILNNNKKDNVTTIKTKLDKLSNLVVSLYKSGVPIEAIVDTLDNTLNEINLKNNLEQEKVLEKK